MRNMKVILQPALFIFVFLTTLLGLSSTADTNGGPLCFNCNRLKDPNACSTVIRCPQGTQCFSTAYLDVSTGSRYWDFGCKSDPYCQAVGARRTQPLSVGDGGDFTICGTNSVSTVKRLAKRMSTNYLTFCISCCKDDFCNLQSCQHSTSGSGQAPSGLVCWSCNDVTSHPGGNCTTVDRCAADEKCAIWRQADGSMNVGCKDNVFCQVEEGGIVGKRAADYRACCDTNFCNLQ